MLHSWGPIAPIYSKISKSRAKFLLLPQFLPVLVTGPWESSILLNSLKLAAAFPGHVKPGHLIILATIEHVSSPIKDEIFHGRRFLFKGLHPVDPCSFVKALEPLFKLLSNNL